MTDDGRYKRGLFSGPLTLRCTACLAAADITDTCSFSPDRTERYSRAPLRRRLIASTRNIPTVPFACLPPNAADATSANAHCRSSRRTPSVHHAHLPPPISYRPPYRRLPATLHYSPPLPPALYSVVAGLPSPFHYLPQDAAIFPPPARGYRGRHRRRMVRRRRDDGWPT